MDNYPLTAANLQEFFDAIQVELEANPMLIISTKAEKGIGKWGMARLWRSWMSTTARFMVGRGVTMPLMLKAGTGEMWGSREFNENDAHELFTANWLGVDIDGVRLSWSKGGRDGMRAADKGERWHALRRHEEWSLDKGIVLLKPRDSEYEKISRQQES